MDSMRRTRTHHLAFTALLTLAALGMPPAFSQIFTNEAPAFGITAYDWNGHYGAAGSTADWNNDGWADITLGSTDEALRGYVNLQGTGFEMFVFPWAMA